jgi:alpha-D-xyloside xylohydrolase
VGAFDVEAPNWGRIPPVAVVGAPAANPDGSVTLPTDAGPLRVGLLECGLRLCLGPDARDYGILLREPAPLAARIEAIEGGTRLVAGERVLEIGHAPLSFALTVSGRAVQSSPGDGHFVRRFRLPPFARMGDAWFVSLELGHDTPVYGLGEKWGRVDRRGQLVRSYNHDALGVNAQGNVVKKRATVREPNGERSRRQ